MDRSKILEFFDATKVIDTPIHVVGCGATGSHICEELARIGCSDIHLWDMDKVDPHNITNQMFTELDVDMPKVDACKKAMANINGLIEVTTHGKGWQGQVLNGYVFLCVDNIDVHQKILEINKYNKYCLGFFEIRMRLTDAQAYFSTPRDPDSVTEHQKTMNFTHEEAILATPISACGVQLSVVYTVKAITALQIANFVGYCLTQTAKKLILVDMKMFEVISF